MTAINPDRPGVNLLKVASLWAPEPLQDLTEEYSPNKKQFDLRELWTPEKKSPLPISIAEVHTNGYVFFFDLSLEAISDDVKQWLNMPIKYRVLIEFEDDNNNKDLSIERHVDYNGCSLIQTCPTTKSGRWPMVFAINVKANATLPRFFRFRGKLVFQIQFYVDKATTGTIPREIARVPLEFYVIPTGVREMYRSKTIPYWVLKEIFEDKDAFTRPSNVVEDVNMSLSGNGQAYAGKSATIHVESKRWYSAVTKGLVTAVPKELIDAATTPRDKKIAKPIFTIDPISIQENSTNWKFDFVSSEVGQQLLYICKRDMGAPTRDRNGAYFPFTVHVRELPKVVAPADMPVMGPDSDLMLTVQSPVIVGREFRITATWRGHNADTKRIILFQTDKSSLPRRAEPAHVEWKAVSRPGIPIKQGEWKDPQATEGLKFRYRKEGSVEAGISALRYWDCMAPKEAGEEYVSVEIFNNLSQKVSFTPAYFVVKIQAK